MKLYLNTFNGCQKEQLQPENTESEEEEEEAEVLDPDGLEACFPEFFETNSDLESSSGKFELG